MLDFKDSFTSLLATVITFEALKGNAKYIFLNLGSTSVFASFFIAMIKKERDTLSAY